MFGLQEIMRYILGLGEILQDFGLAFNTELGYELTGYVLNRLFKSEVKCLLFEIIVKNDRLCHK